MAAWTENNKKTLISCVSKEQQQKYKFAGGKCELWRLTVNYKGYIYIVRDTCTIQIEKKKSKQMLNQMNEKRIINDTGLFCASPFISDAQTTNMCRRTNVSIYYSYNLLLL